METATAQGHQDNVMRLAEAADKIHKAANTRKRVIYGVNGRPIESLTDSRSGESSLMVGFRCIAGNADIGIWECIRDPAFLIFCYHRVTARIYLCALP